MQDDKNVHITQIPCDICGKRRQFKNCTVNISKKMDKKKEKLCYSIKQYSNNSKNLLCTFFRYPKDIIR